jgi:hypothetical protein
MELKVKDLEYYKQALDEKEFRVKNKKVEKRHKGLARPSLRRKWLRLGHSEPLFFRDSGFLLIKPSTPRTAPS